MMIDDFLAMSVLQLRPSAHQSNFYQLVSPFEVPIGNVYNFYYIINIHQGILVYLKIVYNYSQIPTNTV